MLVSWSQINVFFFLGLQLASASTALVHRNRPISATSPIAIAVADPRNLKSRDFGEKATH